MRESESERQSESESDSENDSERESEMESESEIESESERDNACIGHHTSGQRMHWTPGNEIANGRFRPRIIQTRSTDFAQKRVVDKNAPNYY